MQEATVDFGAFVMSLAAGAAAALQEVEGLRSGAGTASDGEGDTEAASPEGVSQRIHANLITARHLIDTLVMLEAKTEGNLTEQELEILRGSLTNLRLSYVKFATPTN
jgi:hypothetical protein